MFIPQKTLQKTSKITTLPALKLPISMKYSRHFHKNRSTARFNAHFKVFHSIKSSPREEASSPDSSIDIIDQIRAYASKLSNKPSIDGNLNTIINPKEEVKTKKMKKFQINFNTQRSSSELKGNSKKGSSEDKFWCPKYEYGTELILPTIKEHTKSKI